MSAGAPRFPYRGGGADDAHVHLFADLNIRASQVFELRYRLTSDFSERHAGFAQLGDIQDEYQRAIVSDQITASVGGALDNLLEAKLHERGLQELIGPDGIRMPGGGGVADVKEFILRGAKLDADLTGFCRALCSALDCMSAAVVGIARLPLSIQRASISHIDDVDDLVAKGNAGSTEQADSRPSASASTALMWTMSLLES